MAGFPSRTASFKTKRLAEKWATTIEAEMIEGRHFKNTAGRRRTVLEAAVRYAREILHIEGVPEFEPGTAYEPSLEAFLKRKWTPPKHPDAPADARNSLARVMWWGKQLSRQKIATVTTEIIERELSKLRTEPYQRSKPDQKNSIVHGEAPRLLYRTEKTINRYIAAGSRLFRIAQRRWHWISANPFASIERASEKGGRLKILNVEQRQRLFDAIRGHPTLYAFCSTARATVVRAGDLQKLLKTDVEFIEPDDPNDKAMGRLAIRQPKNQEPRIVWISGEPLEVLREHISSSKAEQALVFASQTGKIFRYHQEFLAACKRARISDFTFHGWRHDGATHLARLGATEQQLKAIGGWKSNVVGKYVHLAAQDAKAILEKMNAEISEQKS